MIVFYLIVAFIVFFFAYKKNETKIKHEKRSTYDMFPFDTPSLNKTIAIALFWIITLPLIGLWRLLELLYNKFFNK